MAKLADSHVKIRKDTSYLMGTEPGDKSKDE